MMLADPPRSLYLLLIVATIIAGAVCAKQQTKKTAIIFGVCVALLLALFLIGTFVESPRKEAIRRVQAMAKAASETNVDAFMENISSRFDVAGKKKNDLKTSPIWGLIREWNVKAEVYDFNDFKNVSDDEIEFTFGARGTFNNSPTVKYCIVHFVKDADGAWRMSSVKFINPATRVEEQIPGL